MNIDELDDEMREKVIAIQSQLGDFSKTFDNEFIVIGGWAVYRHKPRDVTYDGDAMVSYQVDGMLRDTFNVTPKS